MTEIEMRHLAEKLAAVTSYYLFDIEVETERTTLFSTEFHNLLNEYNFQKAEDADAYFGDFEDCNEESLAQFAIEFNALCIKYSDLISFLGANDETEN